MEPIPLAERERRAADALIAAGLMVDPPFVGHPQSDVYDCWSVCTGSHGGHAKSLREAMRRCFKCCGIGDMGWSVVAKGHERLMRDVFAQIEFDYDLS